MGQILNCGGMLQKYHSVFFFISLVYGFLKENDRNIKAKSAQKEKERENEITEGKKGSSFNFSYYIF